jgi:UPF0716 family protein affecting phage T7 exclusion
MSILGILIYRMSRVASALALMYCIIEMVFKYIERETVGIFPIYILLFVSSMRGTLAFHRYKISQSSNKTET